jgi:hypothetical protein
MSQSLLFTGAVEARTSGGVFKDVRVGLRGAQTRRCELTCLQCACVCLAIGDAGDRDATPAPTGAATHSDDDDDGVVNLVLDRLWATVVCTALRRASCAISTKRAARRGLFLTATRTMLSGCP